VGAIRLAHILPRDTGLTVETLGALATSAWVALLTCPKLRTTSWTESCGG
jgi:hypothetical protein